MVDCYPEEAKDSGIVATRSDMVRKFLDTIDVPQDDMEKLAKYEGGELFK